MEWQMRVLVLSHLFPNKRDAAAGTFVLEQVKQLQAAGIEVVVVSPTPWAPRFLAWHRSVKKHIGIPVGETVDRFEVEHPRVPVLPRNLSFPVEGFGYYAACRGRVRRFMSEGGIDLIHAHTIMPDGFGAVLLGREFNVPVVCTVHGSDISVYPRESRAVAWATKWALKRVTRLIAVSEDLKRKVVEMIGPCEISVAHNGADPNVFKPESQIDTRATLGLPLDKKIVCFVGYFREDKGLPYLLEAFARLRRDDTILCLVGDGPLRSEVSAQAERLGIAKSCLFAGAQPHARVAQWLAAADCLVLSSLTEGLPTILPEAMLCRVPIITTPVGGIPEVVRASETGLIVPCRDSEALARAMNDLLSTPNLASELSQRAFVFAREKLTWSANARATISAYDAALRARKTASQEASRVRPIPSDPTVN